MTAISPDYAVVRAGVSIEICSVLIRYFRAARAMTHALMILRFVAWGASGDLGFNEHLTSSGFFEN